MPDAPDRDCRLYLITPPALPDLPGFADGLARALDAGDVAALQIRLKDVADEAEKALIMEAVLRSQTQAY
ncbi:MAG: hypothetical protein K2X46_14730, partial [Roseomonas sp.]|nr:hypothetical protein [Roseomonas sp.]